MKKLVQIFIIYILMFAGITGIGYAFLNQIFGFIDLSLLGYLGIIPFSIGIIACIKMK